MSTAALAKELAGPGAGAVMAPGQHVSYGKSPFRRTGRLHYRTCVRVQGAVPPVVPVPAVPSTPAAWTRCWTGCSRWRWPAYRTPPWPPTWWGCGSRSPDWSRSSPAGWWSSDRRGAAGVTGAVSTAAWLRGACRLSAGEAGERVRTARVLADDLPVTADALAAGDLSYVHARVLAAAAPELPADPLGALEPVLVEAARHADPAGAEAAAAAAHDC